MGELERQTLDDLDAAERTELARLLGKVEATLCTELARAFGAECDATDKGPGGC